MIIIYHTAFGHEGKHTIILYHNCFSGLESNWNINVLKFLYFRNKKIKVLKQLYFRLGEELELLKKQLSGGMGRVWGSRERDTMLALLYFHQVTFILHYST